MGHYKHEIVNLRFVKVIGTGTDILKSNLLVFLIPHMSLALNISKEKTKTYLVIKALDSQSRGPVFKTTRWLQGLLSLPSFLG